jgi:branched-subunit amino acid transport protein
VYHTPMNGFLLITGMALVTFAIRYPVLALLGRATLPEPVLRALRLVPPAVLTAIVVPAVLMPQGDRLDLGYDNAYLVAGIAAGLIAWRSRNLLLTIVLGMAIFLGWRSLLALGG